MPNLIQLVWSLTTWMNRKWMYKYSCATPNLHKLHALDVSACACKMHHSCMPLPINSISLFSIWYNIFLCERWAEQTEECIRCGLSPDFRGVYSLRSQSRLQRGVFLSLSPDFRFMDGRNVTACFLVLLVFLGNSNIAAG